jgi:DNA ligase 1
LVLSQIFTNMNLKSLLGEKYEEAQMKLKNPDGPPPSKSKAPISEKKTPASKAKSTADKKRKKVDDEDDEDGDHVEEAQEEKPKMTAPKSKGKAAAVIEADDHEEIKAEQKHEDEGKEGVDELAEINGIKPKVYLEDGAEREVSSMSRYGLSFL